MLFTTFLELDVVKWNHKLLQNHRIILLLAKKCENSIIIFTFFAIDVITILLWYTKWMVNYHNGLSTLKTYHNDSMGLHEFFHHSAIISCITFHLWKSVDCYFLNKVYRDILRFLYVLAKTLKYLCTLFKKKQNLQIFIYETLCMKL